MPYFKVHVLAIESDDDEGLSLGHIVYHTETREAAAARGCRWLWDTRLDVTCNPRVLVEEIDLVTCPDALAELYLDSAPEDTESVNQYTWTLRMISRREMEDTGLLKNFEEHAANLELNPALADLTRPVVVTYGDNEFNPLAVWDGVHRIMSGLALDATAIPAVVGIKIN